MQSIRMKELLSHSNTIDNFRQGGNALKPLFSDVGDSQKSCDKLMFALIGIKFP